MKPRNAKMWRESMCDSKKAYKSRQASLATLGYVRHKRLGISKEHRPYECPWCFHWHIGRSK